MTHAAGLPLFALGILGGAFLFLIATAFYWRRVLGELPRLPLWGFLRRSAIDRCDAADRVGAKALMQAELTCSVCGSSAECRARLAPGSGALVPPSNCPNARLFEEFGLSAGPTRK